MAYCRQFSNGSGVIAITLDPQRDFQLEEIRFHYSAAAANESFTVTLDSVKGAAWNTVVKSQSVNGLTDYDYELTRPKPFIAGDVLKIAQANANNINWGVEVIWQPL